MKAVLPLLLPRLLALLLAAALAIPGFALGAALPAGKPPIRSFPVGLDVHPQNNAIAVDDRARVYLGGDGVLIFDGARWERVPASNDRLVRSLAAGEDGRIYVGGYDAFGYLEQSPTGRFVYRELSGLFGDDLQGEPFADIWRLLVTDEAVYFVALKHLFRYEPTTGRTGFWFHGGRFGPIADFQGRVLLQFRGEGMREYRDGRWEPIDSPDAARILLAAVVATGKDELMLLSSAGAWHRYDGRRFTSLPQSLQVPYAGSVTDAIAVGEGQLALATGVGKAVFLDLEKWTSDVVDVSSGFIPDVTRSRSGEILFVDDLGFHAVPWPGPWRLLDDGLYGTVHQIARLGDRLYVLSSSGVFVCPAGESVFKRLDWTTHEAWALLPLGDGDVLFADSYAIYLRRADGRVEIVDPGTTARMFQRSERDPDVIWVGTELGVQVLQRDGESWRSVYRNDDLDNMLVRNIIETGEDEIWVGSERGGVRRFSFRRGENWQLSQLKLGPGQGLLYDGKNQETHLTRIDGQIRASTAAGLFRWQGDRFVAGDDGPPAAAAQGRIAQLAVRGPERWAYTYGQLYRRNGAWREMDVSGLARGVLGPLEFLDDRVFVGALGRILIFDPAMETPPASQNPLNLSSAVAFRAAGDSGVRSLPLDGVELSSADERLTLRYVLADLQSPQPVQYRTRLLPVQTRFSPYSEVSQQSFVALNPGDYRFEVQARDSYGRVSDLGVPIRVRPAWFERPLVRGMGALLLLVLLLGCLALITRRRSLNLRRERDRLEQMVRERTRELATANRQLESMAHLDGLTKIPNRRRLDDYLAEVWQQCIQRSRALAIAIIDVDHFKQYNDSFGHRAGDTLLIALAELLSHHLRRSEDLVARYGGEEFLLVLPGADLAMAREIVEDLRKSVGETDLNVTLSAGVYAVTPDRDMQLEDAIAAADTALYRAKSEGRNRVVVLPAEATGPACAANPGAGPGRATP